ncbi:hypothetical protein HBI81_062150 [Parastagonospora nodorum]|nr:hypothetical protein HBH52_121440 [Parastagonospora nodorum]KAH3984715.1 hypothetical protein HBH51_027350 [Parastagonospora nodorum]KAH4000363.1 hypothetical protein HBI10_100130 [Parastagonospora nodorum]KAH4026689.1 hypothetical protein HBI13_065480 [Parastagonospora nodorum]KAH4036755.1 hypothetical protein HBI09_076990 [Parastagonospora nodorum]
MLEQTKTFISRVSHHAEKTSSPLSPDLILAIQTLKRSSRKTHADPNLFKLLTFLFKITLSTTGPPSSGNADDRLSTIARLKSIEKTDAKHKLCDVLAELEIHGCAGGDRGGLGFMKAYGLWARMKVEV